MSYLTVGSVSGAPGRNPEEPEQLLWIALGRHTVVHSQYTFSITDGELDLLFLQELPKADKTAQDYKISTK